ncbi:MAG: DUF29 domain-containing protein [Cyanobacteria bacterium]|nr:DUF29 domain-containing protein [Cyanobacteria bacterium CG_2015-16_32_12]NCO77137.1 DUF29 domain-containing protein [Cyanobacteria bacterium CG_2015-22_32_23]NCQ05306.1 DUF29 domain-containing protein [Cyanobacteria bacterium CG_2015-09_32_10]NCQ42494.1 DUF29 domain-containing protein [Cyanobacteria bacterium CG_2015-04_32_10]NCS85391.1 DUF29 domain-containing protein [Cyanobacteria bacterium CG_2015-02_32_10]
MVAELIKNKQDLYDTDYNLWVLETVKKLEKRDLDSLDWDNLIEEVLDLSRRDKRKLESLLMRLIEHLLILKYWDLERERNRGHWQGEIINFRKQIKRILKDSPSLKPYLQDVFEECYQNGRDIAYQHSLLTLDTFPVAPIASIEQILDENWLP